MAQFFLPRRVFQITKIELGGIRNHFTDGGTLPSLYVMLTLVCAGGGIT
jgi:hypothetical protein